MTIFDFDTAKWIIFYEVPLSISSEEGETVARQYESKNETQ